MRQRTSARKEQNWGILLLFFIFCVLLIGIGIAIKAYLLFASSTFDGTHQGVLQIVNRKGDTEEIVVLDPDTNSSSLLHFSGDLPITVHPLYLPVDMKIVGQDMNNLSDLGQYILFHQTPTDSINVIDRLRIFLFTFGVSPKNITQKRITLPQDQLPLGQIIGQLLVDNTLYTQNQTITVVNATGVSGIGNATAKIISNIGGDVIAVTTGDIATHTTLVYSQQQRYTARRLAHIFHATLTQSQNPSLSDMTLTIGKDDLSLFQ